MSNTYVQDITDVAARVSELGNYRFLGSGGVATITGYFVDINNVQCSVAMSATVPAANGTATALGFADLYGAALPAAAMGAVCAIAGNPVYMGLMGGDATLLNDMKTNFAKYPPAAVSNMRGFSRVG